MSMIPIASTVVGAGGTATITFSNIPSTFTHLQLRIFGRSTTSGGDAPILLQFNSDYASNYAFHNLQGNGSGAYSGASTSQTAIEVQRISGSTATSGVFGEIIIDILDYFNTNKNKTVRALGGFDNNGSGQVYLNSGLWLSTNAISTILISTYNNFAQNSRIDLYGITNSPATGA